MNQREIDMSPDMQSLAKITRRYKAHNDKIAEGHSEHKEHCTTAELEIIVRESHYTLAKALRRIERLEKKIGIVPEPNDY